MPLCEEIKWTPSEKYCHQPEMLAHSQAIMRFYGLYEKACFGSQVSGLEWDDGRGQWLITTQADDRFYARFVVMNFGKGSLMHRHTTLFKFDVFGKVYPQPPPSSP